MSEQAPQAPQAPQTLQSPEVYAPCALGTYENIESYRRHVALFTAAALVEHPFWCSACEYVIFNPHPADACPECDTPFENYPVEPVAAPETQGYWAEFTHYEPLTQQGGADEVLVLKIGACPHCASRVYVQRAWGTLKALESAEHLVKFTGTADEPLHRDANGNGTRCTGCACPETLPAPFPVAGLARPQALGAQAETMVAALVEHFEAETERAQRSVEGLEHQLEALKGALEEAREVFAASGERLSHARDAFTALENLNDEEF